jgi:hypothetical protein
LGSSIGSSRPRGVWAKPYSCDHLQHEFKPLQFPPELSFDTRVENAPEAPHARAIIDYWCVFLIDPYPKTLRL